MEARLKNSNQWSALPADMTEMIVKLMAEQFTEQNVEAEFIAEGRIYPGEVILRLGHINKGAIRQNNFEGSCDYKAGKDQVIDIVQRLFEATSSMMESFFQDPEIDFPLDWRKFDLEAGEVYLRHSTVNSALEAEADKLLGEHEDQLINKSPEVELEEIKASIGLSEEEIEKDEKKETLH